jgi:16S rRNA (cytosine1402-N4)-methyltransferase
MIIKSTENKAHKSVLLGQILQYMNVSKGGSFVDMTFGAGGYSQAILDANPKNKLIAFDRDENVKVFADKLLEKFGNRFNFIKSRFSQMKKFLLDKKFDAIVFDLGVSSMQLDEGERGFSFSKKAKLNMMMGDNEISALDVVNNYPEEELANIIYKYADEKFSRKIARKIVEVRSDHEIVYTTELADLIEEVKPRNYKSKIHPATKTFQAIRIYVNKELEELEKALEDSIELLDHKGRLLVVTFHSLEDKIVKDFFRSKTKSSQAVNRYMPQIEKEEKIEFKLVTRKVIIPDEKELDYNIRSRSAKLRILERM